jgi:hypothetical protein
MEQCSRGDLTTSDSLKLYTSEFDPSTTLAPADVIFLRGRRLERKGGKERIRSHEKVPCTNDFVRKAARVGVPVIPYSEIEKSKFTPLFPFGRSRFVPEGFEQINEDMFAKKDNKFMVFNGAGIDAFTGSRPVTKIAHEDDILFTTSGTSN